MAVARDARRGRLIVRPPTISSDVTLSPRLGRSCPEIAELDRLPWAAALAGSSYGVRVGIRVTDPAMLSRIRTFLPYGWIPLEDPRPRVHRLLSLITSDDGEPALYSDADVVSRVNNLEQLPQIVCIFAKMAVAELAPRHVFVHAGVVAHQGRAIVLPGQSYIGKTTLTAALVRAGAAYYSDEYAVLDGWGRTHPYAQPLGIRPPGGSVHGAWAPEALGGREGHDPVSVGLVVFTWYDRDAVWEPQGLSRADAFNRTLEFTWGMRTKPERALVSLHRALRRARAVITPRGDADETARRILDLAAGAAA